jgi:hypothetical protein
VTGVGARCVGTRGVSMRNLRVLVRSLVPCIGASGLIGRRGELLHIQRSHVDD